MAFDDSIVARIGLDTRPYARGLRGARRLTEEFAEESKKQLNKVGKNMLQIFGAVGIVRAFRSIMDMAREASEAGVEFSKQGWISAESLSVLKSLEDTFSSIVRNAKEFAAFSVGAIGRFFRLLGAFSTTGSLAEARKVVDQLAEQDRKNLTAARDKADAEQRSLDKSKKKEESLKRQKALIDQIKAQEITLAQAQERLILTKEDRARLTLQELAHSQAKRGTRAFREIVAARDVLRFESEAERQRLLLNTERSSQLFDIADQLRSALTFLTSSERRPFGAMEDAITKSEEHLASLAKAAIKEGVRIIPANGR